MDLILRESHRQVLDDCQGLNHALHKVLRTLEVDLSCPRQVLVSALFARSLEFYQAVMVVLDRGLATAPLILSRALMEAVFTACAIAKDEETIHLYIRNDERYRLKLARKARHLSLVTDDLIDQIKKTVNEERILKLSTEDLAKRAGLHEVYLTAYAVMTAPAHSLVRDMEKYVILDESGKKLKALRSRPPDADSIMALPLSGLLVLHALEAVGITFSKDFGTLRLEYQPKMESYVRTLNKSPFPGREA